MRLAFLFLSLCCFLTGHGQAVFGLVTNQHGIPLPNTNIYVSVLQKGTTSNSEGQYRLNLPPGTWHVVFRNIGYVTTERNITIGEGDTEIMVEMAERQYRIGEIKVLSSGEDPAVYVLRKAIAMAPYYKNQVSEYSSTVYLKGSGKFVRIPRVLKKTFNKQGVRLNDMYSIESLSKIDFRMPDQIRQQVVAQRSSGNANNTSPMPMITSNLYNTAKYGIISPLDRQALNVYQFRMLGMFEDQGRMINRIQIVPRRKGNDVFEGIINVADGYWSVHSADLKLNAPMMEIGMKQIYGPVNPDVWMPVSLSFDIRFDGMGLEFDYVYVASISDYKVTMNPRLDHAMHDAQDREYIRENDHTGNEPHSGNTERHRDLKNSDKLGELLRKDGLAKGEARRLNRMLDKQTAATVPKPPLNIGERIFMDSVHVERTEEYWESIRPVPLTSSELTGFQRKDSLMKVRSDPAWRDSVETERRRFKPLHLLTGKTYNYLPRGSAARNTLTIPGISGINAL
jgi:hypothetical protein